MYYILFITTISLNIYFYKKKMYGKYIQNKNINYIQKKFTRILSFLVDGPKRSGKYKAYIPKYMFYIRNISIFMAIMLSGMIIVSIGDLLNLLIGEAFCGINEDSKYVCYGNYYLSSYLYILIMIYLENINYKN